MAVLTVIKTRDILWWGSTVLLHCQWLNLKQKLIALFLLSVQSGAEGIYFLFFLKSNYFYILYFSNASCTLLTILGAFIYFIFWQLLMVLYCFIPIFFCYLKKFLKSLKLVKTAHMYRDDTSKRQMIGKRAKAFYYQFPTFRLEN